MAIQRNMAMGHGMLGQQTNFGFGFEQGFTNQNFENDAENYYRAQQRAQVGTNTFSQNVPLNQRATPEQQVNPVNPNVNLPTNPGSSSNQNINTNTGTTQVNVII